MYYFHGGHVWLPVADEIAIVDEGCVSAIINLSSMTNSGQNCCELFKDREVYVLLVVTRGEYFSRPRFHRCIVNHTRTRTPERIGGTGFTCSA